MSVPGPYNQPSPAVETDASDFSDDAKSIDDAATGEPELIESVEAGDSLGAPPSPPPKRGASGTGSVLMPITDHDREFIQRVFSQVREVDFRAPPPPPPRKDLAGPDKKIASLRQTVHELERDLARVGYVWGALQQQYEAADRLIANKEAERDSAVARHNQLKELAAQGAARDRAELEASKRRLGEVDAQRAAVETELTNTVTVAASRLQKADQEKAALVADFRAKMEAAQQAFTQLRDQSTRAITDLEKRLAARGEELRAKSEAAAATAATLADREALIATLNTAIAGHVDTNTNLRADLSRQEAAISERARALNTLTDELSHLRGQNEAALGDMRESLKVKDELVEATRKEVRSARAEFSQLGEQHEARRLEIDRANTEVAALRAEVERLKAELQAKEQSLVTAP